MTKSFLLAASPTLLRAAPCFAAQWSWPRVGKKVAAVVKMAKKDENILQAMKDVGVDTFLIPSAETTYSRVFH